MTASGPASPGIRHRTKPHLRQQRSAPSIHRHQQNGEWDADRVRRHGNFFVLANESEPARGQLVYGIDRAPADAVLLRVDHAAIHGQLHSLRGGSSRGYRRCSFGPERSEQRNPANVRHGGVCVVSDVPLSKRTSPLGSTIQTAVTQRKEFGNIPTRITDLRC